MKLHIKIIHNNLNPMRLAQIMNKTKVSKRLEDNIKQLIPKKEQSISKK